ncbi:HIV Tat-specific factor 1-like [Carassius auratus]|uniref:HIV Tat-specific factor 1-like n=1 Tax=Carassius auratus TaxID=7957 RepID=A0A6P6MW13_CARAU|nr:HIV Tat-specific factor 1-like [Carassius auratus]
MCQMALNGRWFGGRKLSAELWDGVTDYQVEETSREREERLKTWSSFLTDESASAKAKADSSEAAEQQNPSTQEAAEQTRQEEHTDESTAKPKEGKMRRRRTR